MGAADGCAGILELLVSREACAKDCCVKHGRVSRVKAGRPV